MGLNCPHCGEESELGFEALNEQAQAQVISAQVRFDLMLQEREFFAKQIRDIRALVKSSERLQDRDLMEILMRPNPLA